MQWIAKHPSADGGDLGFIPSFLSEDNPKSAKEQIADNYVGGWFPFTGFIVNPNTHALHYPGDPPMVVLWEAKLRDEVIRVHVHAWVSITQADGSVEIARLD